MTTITQSSGGWLLVRPEHKPKFTPDEHTEQVALVSWLRKNKILHHSVPNSGATTKKRISYMKKEGLSKGVPDLYILDPPGRMPTAIEMKRANGVESDVKPEQRAWLKALLERGWNVAVCFGAEAAKHYITKHVLI